MAQAVEDRDAHQIEKLLNVTGNRRGPNRVLNDDDEKMICERIIFAAARGFPVYDDDLPKLMAKLADDGRKGFERGLPLKASIRSFRVRHREITLRRGQEKERAKLLAEHPDHARTCERVLRNVIEKHPHLASQPEYIWNMDETEVDGKGRKRKMYCSSSGSTTGFDATYFAPGGPHVTFVVVTSPC